MGEGSGFHFCARPRPEAAPSLGRSNVWEGTALGQSEIMVDVEQGAFRTQAEEECKE